VLNSMKKSNIPQQNESSGWSRRRNFQKKKLPEESYSSILLPLPVSDECDCAYPNRLPGLTSGLSLTSLNRFGCPSRSHPHRYPRAVGEEMKKTKFQPEKATNDKLAI
jgi:hypothetical protein